MTREEFEVALDHGRVCCRMANGRLWSVRRNGATKLWKTRPGEFRVPIKIGFRNYGEVTHQSLNSDELVIEGVTQDG